MRERDGLKAALEDIRTGHAAGLVVAKIDRLRRSSADVLGLVERAQEERWRLIALDVGLDTTTPSGELVAAALAMAARFEWRRISERQLEILPSC
jgi:DNA invertase Pin-like site-specific DNA recombinase